jgi:hypothetical protein
MEGWCGEGYGNGRNREWRWCVGVGIRGSGGLLGVVRREWEVLREVLGGEGLREVWVSGEGWEQSWGEMGEGYGMVMELGERGVTWEGLREVAGEWRGVGTDRGENGEGYGRVRV